MTRTTLAARLAAAVVTGGLLLTGCSAGQDAPAASSSRPAGVAEADVTFAQAMLPHHQQAVEMAGLADGRSQDPAVLDLASRIAAGQEPEIDVLTGWLADWGQDVPSGDGMAGVDHGDSGHGGADGMMTDQDTAALEAASGPEFDRLFLDQMIEHHTGAVTMARAEIEDGEFADAVDMATGIAATQDAEIAEMERLLAAVDR
ncbi:DUF305 domain-containing protein [Modestobacter sp. I12A-02628]|uniref:DUF305 domain-containing protein n=1 Tax=Goekera deserti TaxID=2497753 RepID=A0A7K3WCP7_9ACTN|nr:DUF305 domain-containing protein [Goekera deserti]MPQ97594.1 DUF305 domain-containing protein [Goekera deserti]NDI47802.1 DUF305 domain-containing protein [Goekera deserti]NEL53550.1 DUF305 domain-containing protein [Goekera deserti]